METRKTSARIKSLSESDHTFTFVANSGQVDRAGEILVPEGCDYSNWMRNPLILWAHDDWGLPIAKGLELEVDGDEGLVGEGMFAAEEYEFAATTERLYRAGFLNGFSVRFLPRAWEDFQEGSEEFKSGLFRRYTDWELLEISVVDIPCDPNAVRKAFETVQDLVAPSAERLAAAGYVKRPAPDSRGGALKSAVPFKHFPLADEGMSWSFSAADGNALIEKGGWALYKACHSWQDGDADPETRAAYKLPHHKLADAAVKTVWRGVAAAMARLLSTAKLPENDRRPVYSHLAKHYDEFEKEPPEFKTCGPLEAAFLALGTVEAAEAACEIEQTMQARLLAAMAGSSDEAQDGAQEAGEHLLGADGDRILVEVLEVARDLFGPNDV